MHSIIGRPRLEQQLDRSRRVIATALLVIAGSLASAASVFGETFPDFSAYDQNGYLFELSDPAWDDKIVVIHVCALWCWPCRLLAEDYAAIAAELDAWLGEDNYLFMDLLLYDLYGFGSDQFDAAAWAGLGGNPLVLHVDGAAGVAGVKSFLFPGDTETFPTIVVLDGERNAAGLLTGYADNVETFVTEIVQAVENQVLRVDIDIKPGGDPSCLNVDGRGVIPVAVLGSDSLDVSEIDPQSLLFSGLVTKVSGNNDPLCGAEDTNLDGFHDLVCHFVDDPDYWAPEESTATLTGNLWGGTEFEGSEAICARP